MNKRVPIGDNPSNGGLQLIGIQHGGPEHDNACCIL